MVRSVLKQQVARLASFKIRPKRSGAYSLSSFDQQFQSGPLAAHRYERRGGGSLSTRMIRLHSPAHAVVDPPTDELVLGLIIAGSAAARWAWDSERPNVTPTRRVGTLGLTPVGATGTFEVDGASTILIVALPFEALRRRLEPDTLVRRDFGELHDAYVDHPAARALCRRLWRAAGTASFEHDGLLDSLAESLLIALSVPDTNRLDVERGLSKREQSRVLERAQEPDADVVALAGVAAMPVRTFRRCFSLTHGVSPHRWLARSRIEIAQRQLKTTDVPLSHIALDLGFSSQAHFTEAFRRAVGVSPGRWRREVRS
jgi:AraC family transcriptional regulator